MLERDVTVLITARVIFPFLNLFVSSFRLYGEGEAFCFALIESFFHALL